MNPDTVKAQIEGGIIFGLAGALFGEITIKGGRVEQSNFNDYRMLRIDMVRACTHIWGCNSCQLSAERIPMRKSPRWQTM